MACLFECTPFLIFLFLLLLSFTRERAEREKQYHSHTHTVVSFYLFWFVLIAVERSQNKLQWQREQRERTERERNGRYGIILSINTWKNKPVITVVACCCSFLFFWCCVSVCVWKHNWEATTKQEDSSMQTQWRLNSCYTVKNTSYSFSVVMVSFIHVSSVKRVCYWAFLFLFGQFSLKK